MSTDLLSSDTPLKIGLGIFGGIVFIALVVAIVIIVYRKRLNKNPASNPLGLPPYNKAQSFRNMIKQNEMPELSV